MTKENFSIDFDKELKDMDIYCRYPISLPFIGKNYADTKKKILFVGESNYLPIEYNNKITTEWYDKKLSEYDFSETAKWYLNTRGIVNGVINKDEPGNKAHIIYRNFGNVYAECLNHRDYSDALPHIAFYNYFLRPAEVTGKSIRVNDWGEKILSFDILVKLIDILKPHKVIFLSSLARKTFHPVRWSDERKEIGKEVEKIVNDVPHPSCRWWYKEAKKYGNVTGKQKLKNILYDMQD